MNAIAELIEWAKARSESAADDQMIAAAEVVAAGFLDPLWGDIERDMAERMYVPDEEGCTWWPCITPNHPHVGRWARCCGDGTWTGHTQPIADDELPAILAVHPYRHDTCALLTARAALLDGAPC